MIGVIWDQMYSRSFISCRMLSFPLYSLITTFTRYKEPDAWNWHRVHQVRILVKSHVKIPPWIDDLFGWGLSDLNSIITLDCSWLTHTCDRWMLLRCFSNFVPFLTLFFVIFSCVLTSFFLFPVFFVFDTDFRHRFPISFGVRRAIPYLQRFCALPCTCIIVTWYCGDVV